MKEKLIQINTVCNESTGRIMLSVQRAADKAGYETLSIYGRRGSPKDVRTVKAGNGVSFWLHVALTTALDLHGLGSVFATRKMIRILREEKPDIIHLHNIHGYYLNYPMLFDYLKKEFRGKVFWTLHDCWTFTGHCACYVIGNCEKWKSHCHHCINQRRYPISLLLDNSAGNFDRKKKCFTGVDNMTLLVPSRWLKEQVSQSFLSDYPAVIVPNGIDVSLFSLFDVQQRSGQGAVREKFGIPEGKKILLGVASHWDEAKGIRVFAEMAQLLPDDYTIVLVGSVINRQLFADHLRRGRVILTGRLQNREELSDIYRCSYIFINPSMQETFSMVTIEAMACGLPVICEDSSAVKELVPAGCGIVLHHPAAKDYAAAVKRADAMLEDGTIKRPAIRRHACRYTQERQTDQILSLYKGTVVCMV